MAVSFDDLLGAMPQDRRERILKRSDERAAEEEALQAALDAEAAAERTALSGGDLGFAVYADAGGGFHFRLTGQQGVTLIDSPAFADKAQARAALEAFRRRVLDAELTDQTEAAA